MWLVMAFVSQLWSCATRETETSETYTARHIAGPCVYVPADDVTHATLRRPYAA